MGDDGPLGGGCFSVILACLAVLAVAILGVLAN